MAGQLKEITVIGAGVVGLTTAIKLQEKGGYQVAIVAEIWPNDHPHPHYTSHWAGGHHATFEGDDPRENRIETETFRVFWEMSEPGHPAEKCFIRTLQYQYYFEEDSGHPRGGETMPDFKILPKSALIPGAVFGVSFTIMNFDPKVYLDYLHKRFLAAGGKMVHGSVQHLKQVIEGGSAVFEGQPPAPPAAVVVCAGIGARRLGGVDDTTVTSVRGQTVILHAPWVGFGATRTIIEDGILSYLIPRRNGNLVVGGTMDLDDWYPLPRPEIKLAILEKALAVWPEIAPSEVRNERAPTVEDLLPIIVEEGVGFRPKRKDGIRLEVDWVEARGARAPVVFNYGHGAAGFEASWGSASIAVELLENALKAV